MKKVIFSLFFIVLFLVPAWAGYSVDSVAVTAEVAANGRAQVSMTVQLTFDSATEQVAIPLPNQDAVRIKAADYRSSTEQTQDGLNVVLKKKDGFVGAQTFLIRYAVPYADDGDEEQDTYTLGLLSSRWAQPVGQCSFQVLLPEAFENSPEILSGYYGAMPLTETSLAVTGASFSGSVTNRMAYDSLSAQLVLPEGYFKVRSATLPMISITFLAIGMLAVFLLAVLYWRLKLRTPHASGAARVLAPEGVLPCQLPMVLDGSSCDVAVMVLEWANLGYLSISLSRSGVVLLTRLMEMGSERNKAEQQLFSRIFGRNYRIAATPGRFSGSAARFRAASRRSLSPVLFDRKSGNPALVQLPCCLLLAIGIGYLFYRLLPEGGGFVVLAVLLGLVGLFYSVLLHWGTARFAALHQISPAAAVCWALAVVLLGLSLVAGALPELLVGLSACLFSGLATASGPRRSERGMDLQAQTKGCRTFYRSASWQRLQVMMGKNSRFFQNQLPRAAALGVDKQFARRFERLIVPMPEWLALPGSPQRSAAALQHQLKPILRQLRAAFR